MPGEAHATEATRSDGAARLEPVAAPVDRAAPSGRAPTPYERGFARALHGTAEAFAFWKGRVALGAILDALGVGPGDEVVVPGFTCVVVPNAVRFAGASVRYADVEPGSYNVDPGHVAELIGPRTKVLLLQHTFGLPGPADALLALARRHGLRVVEDCAHALGGTYGRRPLGTLGDAAFFSSQWSKPYTTGLGGLAVTCDPALARALGRVQAGCPQPSRRARVRLFWQYQAYVRLFTPRLAWPAQGLLRTLSRTGLLVGSSGGGELRGDLPPDHRWRMGPAQQAQGARLVGSIGDRARHAARLAERYDGTLRADGWPVARRPPGTSLLRYPLPVAAKERLLDLARRRRVELGSWFESPLHPIPLHEHGRFGYRAGECPEAERMARSVVNLPLHPRVTAAEADRIAAFVVEHAQPAVR
jgi:dTDP-4-amino-4,6-dideoxygalactose transaminase